MEWKDLGTSLIEHAPKLGGLLLGPTGAIGGQLLASLFGSEPTPEKVQQAINADPNAVMKIKELEATKFQQEVDLVKTMLTSDAITPHSTRPKIAYQSFQLIAFSIVIILFGWLIAIINGDITLLTTINDSWVFVGTITSPLVIILHAYFGVLRDEQANKLNSANGLPTNSVGMLNKLFKR